MTLPASVAVTLLTRTLITDFASAASDLEAVCAIAERSGEILSLNSLHAKVYIVDEAQALVTSANATHSGMSRNVECGVELTDAQQTAELANLFRRGFGSRQAPKPWVPEELWELREPVALLRKSLPRMPSPSDVAPRVELPAITFGKYVAGFHGWLGLTFRGVVAVGKPIATLDEVFAKCLPLIAERFPKNRFPRPKVRQQLQRLRDLGILKFLGGSRYELLTLPKR